MPSDVRQKCNRQRLMKAITCWHCPSHLVGWLAAQAEAHLLLKGWKQQQLVALFASPWTPVAWWSVVLELRRFVEHCLNPPQMRQIFQSKMKYFTLNTNTSSVARPECIHSSLPHVAYTLHPVSTTNSTRDSYFCIYDCTLHGGVSTWLISDILRLEICYSRKTHILNLKVLFLNLKTCETFVFIKNTSALLLML